MTSLFSSPNATVKDLRALLDHRSLRQLCHLIQIAEGLPLTVDDFALSRSSTQGMRQDNSNGCRCPVAGLPLKLWFTRPRASVNPFRQGLTLQHTSEHRSSNAGTGMDSLQSLYIMVGGSSPRRPPESFNPPAHSQTSPSNPSHNLKPSKSSKQQTCSPSISHWRSVLSPRLPPKALSALRPMDPAIAQV